MSRPVNLPLNASQQVVNFGVNRGNASLSQARFVDMPRRTAVAQAVYVGTGNQQLTINQIQNDTIIVAPGTGAGSSVSYYLPSASDLLHAFSDLQINKVMRLWVINEGTNRADIFGMTGQGAMSTSRDNLTSVGTTVFPSFNNNGTSTDPNANAPRAIHIQMKQINGSNTGTWGVPPLGATGAYSVW